MTDAQVWIVIVCLGVGTYLIRFSFLGLIGSRPMPKIVLRWLKFTPAALFPGIVAPLVMSPAATGGTFDPARGIAAVVTLLVAMTTRNMLGAIVAGAATLYAMLWLLG